MTKQATIVVCSHWIHWQIAVRMAVCKSDTQFLRKNQKMDTESHTFIILVSFKMNTVTFILIKLIKINTPNIEIYDTKQYQFQNNSTFIQKGHESSSSILV